MKNITIYTDGSCLNNGFNKDAPSPGGWAALLKYKNHIKEISGPIEDTTNNRAELLSVINALKIIKEPCNITIITDSLLIVKTMTENWKKNKNTDLWNELDNIINNINSIITWQWIKGHNNDYYNERVNSIAQIESMKLSAGIAKKLIGE